MNEAEFEQLLETALRRPLTSAEQQRRDEHFAVTPGAREAWELEWRLRRAVRRLPATPVASNFTGRVLERIEAEERAGERAGLTGWWVGWWTGGWFKPALAALALVAAGGAAAVQFRSQQRVVMAQGAAAVSLAARVADLKLMKDFEPIHRLGAVPKTWVDEDLLAALEPGFAR